MIIGFFVMWILIVNLAIGILCMCLGGAVLVLWLWDRFQERKARE